MYVEVNNCDCNVLSMNIGTAAGTRSWNIKITQYDCTFENLAPDGCNKYFFGAAAHLLQTYNFAGNLHLANQRDKFCIRRERNNCQICYTTMINTDFQVSNGGASSGGNNNCCGYGVRTSIKFLGTGGGFDCLLIPGALTLNSIAVTPANNEFCGMNNGITGATVCCELLKNSTSLFL